MLKPESCKKVKELLGNFFHKISSFLKNKKVLMGILFAFLISLLYFFRSVFIAAIVNGKVIPRLTVLTISEKQSGKLALDNLVDKSLIFSEAKKQKVDISKTMIEEEIKKIEDILAKQNTTLDQALEVGRQTRKDLEEQIKIQKTVETILGQKINISEEEINDYFSKNKEFFGKNAKLDTFKGQIKDEIYKQKLTSEYATWIEDLRAKAKIFYFLKF